MNILLDTHTVIWALEDNPKLTDVARDLITNIDNQIFVSSASIWEIAIKQSVKKDFPYKANDIVTLSSRAGFRFLGLGLEEIINYNDLKIKDGKYVNNGPFDKILVSQAKVNEMKLLTHDSVMAFYDESCIISY